jgi:hypothetical protein
VSLRDLPATIVDLLGLAAESPFPGESLARLIDPAAGPAGVVADPPRSPALSEVVWTDLPDTDPAHLIATRRAISSLAERDTVYIRGEEDGQEELYDLRQDPLQSRDLADEPAMRPVLDRLRATLTRLTAGPLTHERFNP